MQNGNVGQPGNAHRAPFSSMARGPEPTGLEAELKAAISLYRDQLEQLRLAVVEDPDNMEIVEVRVCA